VKKERENNKITLPFIFCSLACRAMPRENELIRVTFFLYKDCFYILFIEINCKNKNKEQLHDIFSIKRNVIT
jgi:hypothetical protein